MKIFKLSLGISLSTLTIAIVIYYVANFFVAAAGIHCGLLVEAISTQELTPCDQDPTAGGGMGGDAMFLFALTTLPVELAIVTGILSSIAFSKSKDWWIDFIGVVVASFILVPLLALPLLLGMVVIWVLLLIPAMYTFQSIGVSQVSINPGAFCVIGFVGLMLAGLLARANIEIVAIFFRKD